MLIWWNRFFILNVCDLFGMIGMISLLSCGFFSSVLRMCMNVIVVDKLCLLVFFSCVLNVVSGGVGSGVIVWKWVGMWLLSVVWCFVK